MKALALATAFLFSAGLAATPVCEYVGNEFRVTVHGKTNASLVSPSFVEPTIVCGEKLAAIYDGFDLTVFRVDQKIFQAEKANIGYWGAQLKATDELLALYDGESLLIFDGQDFSRSPANANYYRSQLVVSSEVVSLYDGDQVHFFERGRGLKSLPANRLYLYPEGVTFGKMSLLYDGSEVFVYDGLRGDVEQQTLAARSIFFEAAVAKNRALIYDGEDLFTYCSGRGFSKQFALPDLFVSSGYEPLQDKLWLRVGKKLFELFSNCQLAS